MWIDSLRGTAAALLPSSQPHGGEKSGKQAVIRDRQPKITVPVFPQFQMSLLENVMMCHGQIDHHGGHIVNKHFAGTKIFCLLH